MRPESACNAQGVCRPCHPRLHVWLTVLSRTSLEGEIPKRSYSDMLDHPEVRHAGVQSEYVLAEVTLEAS